MPGKVVAVRVSQGQAVARGEVLMILEAMKMEHPVQAPKDGVVAEVLVVAGQQVDVDALLLVLGDPEGA
jgi:biotin carboxyl carrier protein